MSYASQLRYWEVAPSLTLVPQYVTYVHLDFETYSEAEIKKVGSKLYSEHPTTEILCLAYKVGKGQTWGLSYLSLPPIGSTPEQAKLCTLYRYAADPSVVFVAHNAFFEQCIWETQMVPRGFPRIAIDRWKCTMAKAYAHGLPGGLDKACAALDLSARKDKDGYSIMMRFCKPRKPTKNDPRVRFTKDNDPDGFAKLVAYCIGDVEAESGLDACLRDLSPSEERLWRIDQRINHTGLYLDMPAVRRAVEHGAEHKIFLDAAFRSATDGAVDNPRSRKALRMWLNANGVAAINTKKSTINGLLASANLPPQITDALKVVIEANKSSLAKYQAMLQRSTPDGLLREAYVFYGAHTGRWTGRGVQLQNLPRVQAAITVPIVIGHWLAHDYETFAFLYGDVSNALSAGMRGVIIAPPGYEMFIADYSQIEARLLAYFAGQSDKLQLFAEDKDPYCDTASKLYGYPVTKGMVERQSGKTGDLAFGYQGGIGSMVKFSQAYFVDLSKLYAKILASASEEETTLAQSAFEYYLRRHAASKVAEPPCSWEVAFVADVLKQRWRKAHPQIVKFWADTQAAAIAAVRTGEPQTVGPVKWFTYPLMDGNRAIPYLWCQLPSGRMMGYAYPEAHEDGKDRQGNTKYKLAYWGVDDKGNWARVWTYGGSLVENIVQGAARDVMKVAMLRLESKYPVCLHTHDELAAYVKIGHGSIKEFEDIMQKPLDWLGGCPIKVEGWTATRYGKAA